MRAWLQRFMSGRYGSDAFGNFLCVVSLICLVLGLFVGIFYYIGLALLIYTYFRMLSRNVSKRYAENQMFLQKSAGVRAKFARFKQRFAQDIPLFFLPALQAADPRSQGPRAHFHHLPQVRDPVYQENLNFGPRKG